MQVGMDDEATSTVPYDTLLKILLIGDMDSKKRTILQTYMGVEEFSDPTTLGLDFKLKDIKYGRKRVKLQLWDTAGQERFRSVTASYYRGAHGALLAFTLTKETSFVGLNYWLDEISNYAPVKFQTILVATRDPSDDVEVNLEIAQQFAREKDLILVECSPTDPQNVERTFSTLIDKIMSVWENTGHGGEVQTDDSVQLEPEAREAKADDSKCC